MPLDCVAWDSHDRHPPRFAHVGEVGAMSHHHPKAIPGVVRRRNRPMHRATEESVDPHLVPLKPAGAQDDAAARPHSQSFCADDPHASDLSAVAQKFLGARIRLWCYPGIKQSLEQSGYQSGPGHAHVAGTVVD
jgi:hypothetical protein